MYVTQQWAVAGPHLVTTFPSFSVLWSGAEIGILVLLRYTFLTSVYIYYRCLRTTLYQVVIMNLNKQNLMWLPILGRYAEYTHLWVTVSPNGCILWISVLKESLLLKTEKYKNNFTLNLMDKLIHVFIFCKLDHCKYVFIENKTSWSSFEVKHINSVLNSLHWRVKTCNLLPYYPLA